MVDDRSKPAENVPANHGGVDDGNPFDHGENNDEQRDAGDIPQGESEEVLQRLRDDGEQALADAFAVHRDRYWHLVTFRMDRRLASRVDADDILQESFVNASTRLQHYLKQPTYSLFVWLRLIVAQTLVDAHRRHLGAAMRSAGREISLGGPRFPQSTCVSLAQQLAADQTSPSTIASRNELSDTLSIAIGKMPELDQETIALRHFEGLTNLETAEVLGISVTAASNRYVRALARLKTAIEATERDVNTSSSIH